MPKALLIEPFAEAIALADHMASEHDDFIRKHSTVDLVFKENEDALLSAEPERHLVDDAELVRSMGEVVAELRQEFAGANRRLKQRVQELER
jgi:hypothetical protein